MGEVPIELNTKYLGFSWKVGVAQLNAELQSFVEASRDIDAEQKDWVNLAKTLTEQIGTLRKDNRALKEEFKQVAAVTGKESALFEDLKTTSIVECLDRIPQIDQLRRISEDIAQGDVTRMDQLSEVRKHEPSTEQLSLESLGRNQPVDLNKLLEHSLEDGSSLKGLLKQLETSEGGQHVDLVTKLDRAIMQRNQNITALKAIIENPDLMNSSQAQSDTMSTIFG